MVASTTGSDSWIAGSDAASSPSRESSRKPASTTVRWSTVGPPLPRPYEIAALGSPDFATRMKYGCDASDPDVVTVQPLIERCHWSAVARNTAAEAASPLTSAMSAAEISPAISAAMVEGEYPPCSSHRSGPKLGPWATTKYAAGRMWCV